MIQAIHVFFFSRIQASGEKKGQSNSGKGKKEPFSPGREINTIRKLKASEINFMADMFKFVDRLAQRCMRVPLFFLSTSPTSSCSGYPFPLKKRNAGTGTSLISCSTLHKQSIPVFEDNELPAHLTTKHNNISAIYYSASLDNYKEYHDGESREDNPNFNSLVYYLRTNEIFRFTGVCVQIDTCNTVYLKPGV